VAAKETSRPQDDSTSIDMSDLDLLDIGDDEDFEDLGVGLCSVSSLSR
jgi:hypothetical protein